MAGLLDGLFGPDSAVDPRLMGLLGMAGQAGQAFAPQPASRLPLAKPSIPYMLTQAAGGYGRGFGSGVEMQQAQAQTQGTNLENYGRQINNANAAINWNLMAPFLQPYMGGQQLPQLPMSQFGGNAPGPVSPGAPQGPVGAAPSAPTPAGGGMPPTASQSAPGATPAASAGQPDLSNMYDTMPPFILKKMGVNVPPELDAAYAAGIQPGSPQWKTLTQNVALKGAGIAPTFGGERPGIPFQQNSLGPNGQLRTSVVPGALEAQAAGAANLLSSQEAKSAFDAGLRVNTENEIAKRQTFYQTGVMPPDYGMHPATPPQAPNGDFVTERGTVVPAATPTQFIGTDALAKMNTNTQETEKGFAAVRAGLDGTENRMVLLAKAMQQVEGKGLNEAKAHASQVLRGLGLSGAADQVMSAKDVSAVQQALGAQTIDVLGQLRVINQGGGGRILNSEFTNLLDKNYGPDLLPEANYRLITQALGGIYQTRNMIDDYYQVAKPNGERDANAFQSKYLSKPQNSYDAMVQRAEKTIGPLKGMPQLPHFSSASDPALQMLPKGAHFIGGDGTEYIK